MQTTKDKVKMIVGVLAVLVGTGYVAYAFHTGLIEFPALRIILGR